MSPETEPSFPVLEIVSFVDAYTAILVGPHVDRVKQGERLYVLGIGFSTIPKVNVPLIAPKAELETTFAAGVYVLAKTPLREFQTDIGMNVGAAMASLMKGQHTYAAREKITNLENLFLGDPGKEPIKLGDVVIRTQDLAQYIAFRASQ